MLMSKSLQDQLLSLGVANKKKAKQAKHQQRIESKEPKGPGIQESLQEAQQKAREEKKARDQALAAEREAKRLKAEKLAQVRDMVKSNVIDRGADAGRVDFRFPYGKKIRLFPVSADVRDRLARGMIGLIELDGAICVVPRDILEKCIERLEGQEIFSHLAKLEEQDDDYPPIPDDLDW
jgi:uncharacterized protein YaiL (DUF2058 family)